MKRTIIAVSLCLLAAPAYAVDWSLNSTLTENVEVNSNPYLRALVAGAFDSYSDIAANAIAKTPDSKFTFDGDVNYRKYWGPGADGAPTESLGGSTKLHYETYGKNTEDREYLDADWTRQSTAFALLGQLGIVTNSRGFLDTTTVGGGIDRSLTHLDTVSLSAHSTYTSFDPGGGGTPFIDTDGTASWRHHVSSIATASVSSDVEELNFDNSLNTAITILRENLGLDASITPLLSFSGTAGVAHTQTEHGSPAISLQPTSTSGSGSFSDTAFITNMVLTYKMFPDTTVSINGLRTIAPSVVGSLIQTTSVGTNLAYTVNPRENLSFGLSDSQTTSSGTTSQYLSASVAYGYSPTREWNAQLSYRYLHRFSESGIASSGVLIDPVTGLLVPTASGLGPADSHSIMLVVSRSVSVLPDGY